MCLGSSPEASLKLAKADLHGICHVNDTKNIYIYIYLHGNCHGNLSCDFVLTWECHAKEPVNQELPQGLPLPCMGIPCKWAFETCNQPPLLGRHGNPMVPGTRKRACTWDSTSILQDFAAGFLHMESPCGSRCISQLTWFFPCGRAFSCCR